MAEQWDHGESGDAEPVGERDAEPERDMTCGVGLSSRGLAAMGATGMHVVGEENEAGGSRATAPAGLRPTRPRDNPPTSQ